MENTLTLNHIIQVFGNRDVCSYLYQYMNDRKDWRNLAKGLVVIENDYNVIHPEENSHIVRTKIIRFLSNHGFLNCNDVSKICMGCNPPMNIEDISERYQYYCVVCTYKRRDELFKKKQ